MGWRTTFRIALLLLGLSSFPACAEKRVALVIGNSAYQNATRLTAPANDAAAIADTLKKSGFDAVELGRDLSAADMKRTLDELSGKSVDADTAIVYFAGHSIEIDGMTYLAPVDASGTPGESIALDRVLQSIQSTKQFRLVIVDACHGNPFARDMSGAGCALPRNLVATISTRPGTAVAFAAKTGAITRDGGEASSPFATALLKHLATATLDLQQVLTRGREDVMNATGNGQEPFVVGSLAMPPSALVPNPPSALAAKPQREDPSKVNALDRVRLAMEVATAERITRDKAEAEARTAKAREQAEATGSISGSETDTARRVAALPGGTGRFTQRDLNRSLQAELRRVGCQTAPASDQWTPASRRSLELFNRHTGLKLDVTLASLDALEAVKGRQAHVCR